MNAQLPRRSGGFELQRELGRGGMRVVALKVLLAEHSVSEEAFERFQREARIAASISDSRCVFVYGAHQIDDSPAISMELVGGETLEHKLARGESIPIQTAVRWTLDGHHDGLGRLGEPTGKRLTLMGMSHYHVRGGRVVEEWTVFDELSLLVQLEMPTQ